MIDKITKFYFASYIGLLIVFFQFDWILEKKKFYSVWFGLVRFGFMNSVWFGLISDEFRFGFGLEMLKP